MPNPPYKRSRSIAQSDVLKMVQQVDKVDFSEHWMKKTKKMFALLDLENTGIITQNCVDVLTERIKKYANMSPEQSKDMQDVYNSWKADLLRKTPLNMDCDTYVKLRYVLLSNPEMKEDVVCYYRELAKHMFNALDTSQDGIISREEWWVFYQSIGIFDEKKAKESFDAIDTNEDGKMSEEEFLEGWIDYNVNQNPGNYDSFLGPL